MLLNMNFSSRTTSLDVQRNLEANVEKRTKDTYGPPPGKRLLIFIDDMNMPQVGNAGERVFFDYIIIQQVFVPANDDLSMPQVFVSANECMWSVTT